MSFKIDTGYKQKMLTQQLRELEYNDIVHREVYNQVPPKVEYSISEYGKGLSTVLKALNNWGAAHMEHMNTLYGVDRSRYEIGSTDYK